MSERAVEKVPWSSKKLIAALLGLAVYGLLAWLALEKAEVAIEAKDTAAAAGMVETAQECIKYAGYVMLTFLGGQATLDTMVRRARERTEQAKYKDSMDPEKAQMPEQLRGAPSP